MKLTMSIKSVIIFFCITITTLLQAQTTLPPFEIDNGVILYEVTGGGALTPETNLTLQAKVNYIFSLGGDIYVEEVEGVVQTHGSLNHYAPFQRWTKETKDTIYTVDFENEQLLKRQKSIKQKALEKQNLKKVGSQEVAGYLCEIWEGRHVRKSIYKGVVLKLYYHFHGISYLKEAKKVYFDSNRSKELLLLPDYPLQPFGLFRDKIKTKNIFKSEGFCQVIDDIASMNTETNQTQTHLKNSRTQKEKFIHRIGTAIFDKQKQLLPKILHQMKKQRECLQMEETLMGANACTKPLREIKQEQGYQKSEYIVVWDESIKKELLDKLEEDIIDLESRIGCVKRAKNIYDLSACMK